MHRVAVVLLLCAPVSSALAHPNHAGGGPLATGLLHLLTQPDHLLALLLPFALIGAITAVRRRRRLAAGAARPARAATRS